MRSSTYVSITVHFVTPTVSICQAQLRKSKSISKVLLPLASSDFSVFTNSHWTSEVDGRLPSRVYNWRSCSKSLESSLRVYHEWKAGGESLANQLWRWTASNCGAGRLDLIRRLAEVLRENWLWVSRESSPPEKHWVSPEKHLSLAWEVIESRERARLRSVTSAATSCSCLFTWMTPTSSSCVSQIHTYCTSHLTSYISTSHILHFHALHRTSLHLTSYSQLFTWMTPTSPKVPNPHIYLHLSIIQGTYISPLFSAQFSIFPPPWPGVDIFCTWMIPGNVPLSFHPSFQSKHVNQSLNQLINHY